MQSGKWRKLRANQALREDHETYCSYFSRASHGGSGDHISNYWWIDSGSAVVRLVLPLASESTNSSTTFAGQLMAGADLTQNDDSPFSSDTTGFVFNESTPIQIGPLQNSDPLFGIPGG